MTASLRASPLLSPPLLSPPPERARRIAAAALLGLATLLTLPAAALAATPVAGEPKPGQWVPPVAAVVDVTVDAFEPTYDELNGPRLQTRFRDVKLLGGQLDGASPDAFQIPSFGGPLPDGRHFVHAAHTTVLVPGSRMILFLARGPWWVSPVIYGLGFRVVTLMGRTVVTTPDGRAVVGVGEGVRPVVGARLVGLAVPGEVVDPKPLDGVRADDVATALSPEDFVAAATTSAAASGEVFGGEYRRLPTASSPQWDKRPTVPYEGEIAYPHEELRDQLERYATANGVCDEVVATHGDIAGCLHEVGAFL